MLAAVPGDDQRARPIDHRARTRVDARRSARRDESRCRRTARTGSRSSSSRWWIEPNARTRSNSRRGRSRAPWHRRRGTPLIPERPPALSDVLLAHVDTDVLDVTEMRDELSRTATEIEDTRPGQGRTCSRTRVLRPCSPPTSLTRARRPRGLDAGMYARSIASCAGRDVSRGLVDWRRHLMVELSVVVPVYRCAECLPVLSRAARPRRSSRWSSRSSSSSSTIAARTTPGRS